MWFCMILSYILCESNSHFHAKYQLYRIIKWKSRNHMDDFWASLKSNSSFYTDVQICITLVVIIYIHTISFLSYILLTWKLKKIVSGKNWLFFFRNKIKIKWWLWHGSRYISAIFDQFIFLSSWEEVGSFPYPNR